MADHRAHHSQEPTARGDTVKSLGLDRAIGLIEQPADFAETLEQAVDGPDEAGFRLGEEFVENDAFGLILAFLAASYDGEAIFGFRRVEDAGHRGNAHDERCHAKKSRHHYDRCGHGQTFTND